VLVQEEDGCDEGITCWRVECTSVSDGTDVEWMRPGWRFVGFSGALKDERNIVGEWYGCSNVAKVVFWYLGGAVSARGVCQ
jgi:hypothetical protein